MLSTARLIDLLRPSDIWGPLESDGRRPRTIRGFMLWKEMWKTKQHAMLITIPIGIPTATLCRPLLVHKYCTPRRVIAVLPRKMLWKRIYSLEFGYRVPTKYWPEDDKDLPRPEFGNTNYRLPLHLQIVLLLSHMLHGFYTQGGLIGRHVQSRALVSWRNSFVIGKTTTQWCWANSNPVVLLPLFPIRDARDNKSQRCSKVNNNF